MRDEFKTIISGWTLIDGIDDLTDRIERVIAWSRTNSPLRMDETATLTMMIQSQMARGFGLDVDTLDKMRGFGLDANALGIDETDD